jgi:hypothetical protein
MLSIHVRIDLNQYCMLSSRDYYGIGIFQQIHVATQSVFSVFEWIDYNHLYTKQYRVDVPYSRTDTPVCSGAAIRNRNDQRMLNTSLCPPPGFYVSMPKTSTLQYIDVSYIPVKITNLSALLPSAIAEITVIPGNVISRQYILILASHSFVCVCV